MAALRPRTGSHPQVSPAFVSAWGHPAFSHPRTCAVMCDFPPPSISWGRVENVGGCQPPTHVQSSVTGFQARLGCWGAGPAREERPC